MKKAKKEIKRGISEEFINELKKSGLLDLYKKHEIEYIKQRNNSKEIQYGRWDIIAISKNKDKNGKHKVVLIELKCSEEAIVGKVE